MRLPFITGSGGPEASILGRNILDIPGIATFIYNLFVVYLR